MPSCPVCSSPVAEGSRFCSSCGANITLDDDRTVERSTPRPSRSPSSGSIDHGRFLPGSMLGERYRVVALLGKGGMGEVYRADDVKLNQPVALKLLPRELSRDPERLERFLNEVRIARQIAHPNVCRVYDIGEIAGEHFISMEYVRGEDLASLLQRIGRLPQDKGVQIARQICAGLAAAHEKGVLHRDLKPANVMLDDRGVVRLTDFGLAAIEEDLQQGRVREGTPQYMAPEQLEGKEVSLRSDIYSLGLVLYEIFTGQPAFKAATLGELLQKRREGDVSSPATVVAELDPAVDRVILRCLEPQPRDRPSSAIAVSAALPGGDPLAAALAAGETPSPELVAASGERAGISPRLAFGLLGVIAMGLIATLQVQQLRALHTAVPMPLRPEVLESKGRDLVAALADARPPVSSASGFETDDDFVRWLGKNRSAREGWRTVRAGHPSAIRFWYRESPRRLIPEAFFSVWPGAIEVTASDPPPLHSGERILWLDPDGRLTSYTAIPPERVDGPVALTAAPPEADWRPLFAAAGVDPAKLRPVAPRWNSLAASDVRRAWEGEWPGSPGLPLRIEAASRGGRPVSFLMIGPWTRASRMDEEERNSGQVIGAVIMVIVFAAIFMSAVFVARRNLRLGRGDRRGAFRLGVAMVIVSLLSWLFGTTHVAALGELALFIMGMAWALVIAVSLCLLYLAMEPYVRRRWPESIVSWSRLLGGRVNDPLVARDLLLGAATFTILPVLELLILAFRPVDPPGSGVTVPVSVLSGRADIFAAMLTQFEVALFFSLSMLFAVFLLRVLLRNAWLAYGAFLLIFMTPSVVQAKGAWMVALNALFWAIVLYSIVRLGFLVAVSLITFWSWLQVPLVAHLGEWQAWPSIVVIVSVVMISLWAAWTALAGRPLLREGLLDA